MNKLQKNFGTMFQNVILRVLKRTRVTRSSDIILKAYVRRVQYISTSLLYEWIRIKRLYRKY